MKWVISFAIRIYWYVVPVEKRSKCIFHISCSKYVYEKLKSQGLRAGLKALKFRFSNCRYGYSLYLNPVDGTLEMLLPSGAVIRKNEIAERLHEDQKSLVS